MENNDHVDSIVNQWKHERPDLDVTPMGVIGRLSRLSRHIENKLKHVFEAHGLSQGEFDVLATLRRSGEPYQLTPTVLFKSAMLSSGAMTNRLNKLEEAGLIERLPDPHDRRGTIVSLTEQGMQLVDRAVTDHVENEHNLLAAYSEADIEDLTNLLRKLLLHFEDGE